LALYPDGGNYGFNGGISLYDFGNTSFKSHKIYDLGPGNTNVNSWSDNGFDLMYTSTWGDTTARWIWTAPAGYYGTVSATFYIALYVSADDYTNGGINFFGVADNYLTVYCNNFKNNIFPGSDGWPIGSGGTVSGNDPGVVHNLDLSSHVIQGYNVIMCKCGSSQGPAGFTFSIRDIHGGVMVNSGSAYNQNTNHILAWDTTT